MPQKPKLAGSTYGHSKEKTAYPVYALASQSASSRSKSGKKAAAMTADKSAKGAGKGAIKSAVKSAGKSAQDKGKNSKVKSAKDVSPSKKANAVKSVSKKPATKTAALRKTGKNVDLKAMVRKGNQSDAKQSAGKKSAQSASSVDISPPKSKKLEKNFASAPGKAAKSDAKTGKLQSKESDKGSSMSEILAAVGDKITDVAAKAGRAIAHSLSSEGGHSASPLEQGEVAKSSPSEQAKQNKLTTKSKAGESHGKSAVVPSIMTSSPAASSKVAAATAKPAADKKKKSAKDLAAIEKITDLQAKWAALHERSHELVAAPYKMSDAYEAKTAISHKVLGWGYVLSNVNDRLEVLFKDGIKILISNYK